SRVGYPVMVKATDGGGGKGMRLVRSDAELDGALERARSEALKAFGNADVYIEKALEGTRHVEVQVLGDRGGHMVHLFERDCSLQRRHQKIVEETPCPALDPATRSALCAVAVQGARSLGYYSAGTFEFLLDQSGSFYFLEMNTRLQVEHPVTELVTGIDLVREMLTIAAGEPLLVEPETRGVAIEARLCAEDPARGFAPSPGRIETYVTAAGPGVRDDSGIDEGSVVSPHYDPLLAKLAVWAPNRAQALARLRRALGETVIAGIETNVAFLEGLLRTPEVEAGRYDNGFVERHAAEILGPSRASDEPLLAAAAAVVAALAGASARPEEADGNGLSPWVMLERQGRLAR
ncbi:MAG TPA: acetyl-CoA carboxylase biotin carboxylase subunit, partial [Polyangiaceae bacterium]|nr:acetyl-CoA carboxylase biotin carboxylase subunit [Polyangiaceae bacterium]